MAADGGSIWVHARRQGARSAQRFWTLQRAAGRDAWCRASLTSLCEAANELASTVLCAQAASLRSARPAIGGVEWRAARVAPLLAERALDALDSLCASVRCVVALLRVHRICELSLRGPLSPTSSRVGPACTVRIVLAAATRAASVYFDCSVDAELESSVLELQRVLNDALRGIAPALPLGSALRCARAARARGRARECGATLLECVASTRDCAVLARALEDAASLPPPSLARLAAAEGAADAGNGPTAASAAPAPPRSSPLARDLHAYRVRASAEMRLYADAMLAQCSAMERASSNASLPTLFTPNARVGLLARAHGVYHRYFGVLLRRARLQCDATRATRFTAASRRRGGSGNAGDAAEAAVRASLARDSLAGIALRCGDVASARALWVPPLALPPRACADIEALHAHFFGARSGGVVSAAATGDAAAGAATAAPAAAMGRKLACLHDPLLVGSAAVMISLKVLVGAGLSPRLFARTMWRVRFGGGGGGSNATADAAADAAVQTWSQRLLWSEEAILAALDYDINLDTADAALPAACDALLSGALLRLRPAARGALPVARALAHACAPAARYAAAALLVPVASEMISRALHVPLCFEHTPAAIARAAVLLAASRVGLVATAASDAALHSVGVSPAAHSALAAADAASAIADTQRGGRIADLRRRWDALSVAWLSCERLRVASVACAVATAARDCALASVEDAARAIAECKAAHARAQGCEAGRVASHVAAEAARDARGVVLRAQVACERSTLVALVAYAGTIAMCAADAARGAAQLAAREALRANAERRKKLRKRSARANISAAAAAVAAPAAKRQRRAHRGAGFDEDELQRAIDASLAGATAPPPPPPATLVPALAPRASVAALERMLGGSRAAPPKPMRRWQG